MCLFFCLFSSKSRHAQLKTKTIYRYGPRGYAEDTLNLFDAAVVLVSIVETIVSRGNSGGIATAFRALRVIRVVRISRFMRSLRILIGTIQSALPAVGWMIMLMIFAIFVFGLMGTQLFREKFENPQFELQTLHPYVLSDVYRENIAFILTSHTKQNASPIQVRDNLSRIAQRVSNRNSRQLAKRHG